ncbi:MAG: DUF928 domain-containing protein [Coleofasciculus sp. C1-SOL-03]|jgi:hypothetical protein|uniref:DUF928 domain-containing protein n=1 Tax=Coleofasciculus sp. C1-SOL-03 TaxID=3069522 RepID=UPI0033017CDB
MAWFTHSSRFTVALALTLGLVANVPAGVQAQLGGSSLNRDIPTEWEFTPPTGESDNPIAINRQGGGTRGPCIKEDRPPIALVPMSVGKTVAEYPTLSWYLPKNTAWGVQLVVKDAQGEEVYATKYAFAHYTGQDSQGDEQQFVVGAPGIMSLTLPQLESSTLPPEVGQEYSWELGLICDYNSPSSYVYVEGKFERVEPDPNLTRRLQQATPEQRVSIYANERLWYDTLNTLVELRRQRPNDPTLKAAWSKLLRSVELDVISEEPVAQGVRTNPN